MTEKIVATLGDSITAGTPGWDPDPAVRAAKGATNEQSSYQYWAAQALPDLSFRNHGVNGERTEEIALRLEEAAQGAFAIVVQGGINDIVQGRDPEDAAAHTLATARRAREMGLTVAIADVLPWNNGWPEAAGRVDALNSLIHALAAEEALVTLPFYETLVSPELPGRMPAEWTAEGNHPSVEGYRRLGTLAFSPWW